MQILFVHPNFPAQFGPVARQLARRADVDCVFLSKNTEGIHDGIRCIRYTPQGGATRATHYCSRSFENAVWEAHAVYQTCQAHRDLHPDLIVAHSGFGTTAFLPELYDCPIINLFEFYYHSRGGDSDFRPEFPGDPRNRLRARTRNAMILTDLTTCTAGYAPTHWQWQHLPAPLRSKVAVIHDGIDTDFWYRRAVPRRLGDEVLDPGVRVVTYVARGLEAMRGFDIFVRLAKRIAAVMPDVLFVVVGAARTCYGSADWHRGAASFKDHVLASEQPDLTRFRFLGTLPPAALAQVLSLSDLHVYLTVPFVLSWSLLNAMACQCTVLGSDTAPVREVIDHGHTGLLADFHDVQGLAEQALAVLREPARHRILGEAARQRVVRRYSLPVVYPQMCQLYARALGREHLFQNDHVVAGEAPTCRI